MDLVRTLARPMLGSMFVLGGIDAVRNAEKKVPKAENVVAGLNESLGLPGDTVTLVRVNGTVQVVAGLALGAGKFPRLAALALAASLVPTTLAGHAFWNETEASARAAQRTQFFKNVSMLGGLVLAADDTGGRPSIPWRIHEAVDHAREGLPHAMHG